MVAGETDGAGFRQLHAFVAVAETLSFSRAAERLGTSQPPVSRLVLRMERRLGAVVFERDSHSVRLTAAGQALLEPARAALGAVAAFESAAAGVAAGQSGALRVGTTEGAAPLLATVLAAFARTHPGVEVRLEQDHTPAKLQRLLQGELDVAFVRNPPPTPQLRMVEVSREPLLAVVSSRHRLAARPTIDLAELAEDPLILTPSTVNTGVRDAVLELAAAAGFTPRLGPPFYNGPDAIAQIASSSAWTLLGAGAASSRHSGVVHLVLTDPSASVAVTLAWRSAGRSPALAGFLRAART